jgi:hypothetical protein
MALLSRWYQPALLLLGIVRPASRSSRRRRAGPLRALMVIWLLTWAILHRDLFRMNDWFWD